MEAGFSQIQSQISFIREYINPVITIWLLYWSISKYFEFSIKKYWATVALKFTFYTIMLAYNANVSDALRMSLIDGMESELEWNRMNVKRPMFSYI